MEVKNKSSFKSPAEDKERFRSWVKKLESINNRTYQEIEVKTSIGLTHVWGLNTELPAGDTLVIFPGARTTPLFWDFDNNLDHLNHPLKIYLVETNGLPNLSDGSTPDIRSLDYGIWANEVLDQLKVEKAFVAGASFGGLICMKLCITNPEKVKAAFLLNPGCLQPFSMGFKNLYYNLLPILFPSEKTVLKFLDAAVFCKPNHMLSPKAEKLIVDYEVFALTRYNDKTQKPYYMADQLNSVMTDIYLLEGDKDLLFPFQKSIDNARARLANLKHAKVFENVGHGIETYAAAMNYIGESIKKYK
ncbi:MAG TPA: alpha/beta fold hydrolase [Cyclobacteriaceae bacterium]|nr:alpha/beta fold hydrolase [Cyclobacteriaceae bacterium]